MGDMNSMTSLPQAPAEKQQEAAAQVKRKAKYSRSKEFQELKGMMENRIEFYKAFLPNGTPAALASKAELEQNWPVANIVIAELQQVIDMYQNAEEELKAIDSYLR